MTTDASAAMTALGDPTRRAIFAAVVAAPCAVGELARGLPVSRPAVSQHLKVLKQAGLVVDEAVGARRVYRADPQALADMQAYFQAFWDQALAGFRDQAERRDADG